MTVYFAAGADRAALARGADAGRLRRLARGVYTDELDSTDEEVVADHRWEIVAHFVPDAVIVDRSAAGRGAPTEGTLFVASETRVRDVELSGLRIVVRRGPRLESDSAWTAGLVISAPARTLVDNLAVSRSRGTIARTLSRAELGDWVAHQAGLMGEARLNRLRDEARQIAAELGVPNRADEVDALIGAALGTRLAPAGSRSRAARAAQRGHDEDCVRRFDEVATVLAGLVPDDEVPAALPAAPDELRSSLGFWEAYFSNHIEGTVFAVEQAEEIVASGQAPTDRPADGHDILGTYRVVTDPLDRQRVPRSPDEFAELLRNRHAAILGGRPGRAPGQWKVEPNQAGSYVFVPPDLVEGTLAEGFGNRDRLVSPFARALYVFFVVSEVHPFSDGNGRVARTMMNAELSHGGQTRIVIPIVWRNEYFTSLRLLSREGDVGLYVRTLALAWRWTAAMNWSDHPTTAALMDQTNALLDSTDAANSERRLLLPAS